MSQRRELSRADGCVFPGGSEVRPSARLRRGGAGQICGCEERPIKKLVKLHITGDGMAHAASNHIERRLAYAVVEWLDHKGERGEELEGLAVASHCVAEVFNLSLDDMEQRERFGTAHSLLTLFEAGCDALGSHCSQQHYERAMSDVKDDHAFNEFLGAVESKGYFDGYEPNSSEYRARYVRAVDMFLDRRRRPAEETVSDDASTRLRAEELEVSPQLVSPAGNSVYAELAAAVTIIARALEEPDVGDMAAKILLQNPHILQRLLDSQSSAVSHNHHSRPHR